MTTTIDGYTVKIEQDPDPESSRAWGNFGTMVCWHSRYDLGDMHNYKDPDDFKLSLACEADPGLEDKIRYWESGRGWANLQGYADPIKACEERVNALINKALDKYYVILPLYLYDHSGVTMNTTGFSCRWDSGQVGYIYVSRKKIFEEYGGSRLTKKLRKRIEGYLEGEVETYDQYLTGQVFGYVIEDASGEEVESCWGFYGEDYCLEAAKAVVKFLAPAAT